MANATSEDVRKAVNTAFEQIKTSMLAALGAGNLASQAVADAVAKARSRVNESSETARKNIEELPADVESIRERLDPTELRKVLDEYTDSALKLYHKLAESGEETWERFVSQPQVKRSIEQLEEALQAAQERVDDVTSDARERVDEVFSRVAGRTRQAGERAGTVAEDVTDRVADRIVESAPEAETPAEPAGASRQAGRERKQAKTAKTAKTPKTAKTTSAAARGTSGRTTSTTRKPQGGSRKSGE